MKINIKSNDDKILELQKFVKIGDLIKDFEKTDVYKLIVDWIKKEGNYKKIFTAPNDDKREVIGYVRFGEALLSQFEIWKNVADKKRIEINKLLSEK